MSRALRSIVVGLSLSCLTLSAAAQPRDLSDCESDEPSVSPTCKAVDRFAGLFDTYFPDNQDSLRKTQKAVDAAYAFRDSLDRYYPRWTEYLPACPLRVDSVQANPAWEADLMNYVPLVTFHPGADACYRTARTFTSSSEGPYPNEPHRQQCCYKDSGDLLTSTQGSGTPDFSDARHVEFDVDTWSVLPGGAYTGTWRPNVGGHDVEWTSPTGGTNVQAEYAVTAGERLHVSAQGSTWLRFLVGRTDTLYNVTPSGLPPPAGVVPSYPECPWLSIVGVVWEKRSRYSYTPLETHCIGYGADVTVGHTGVFGVYINQPYTRERGVRFTSLPYFSQPKIKYWVRRKFLPE